MAALNYAQKWESGLIKTFIDGSYIAPFVATDVNFIGAKTFHFTTLNTSGYKAHSLAGGWQRGTYNQKDHPYTLEHDRDVEFFIDKRDVDETNKTASIQNISAQFQRTQATPEMDAQFFSKIAAEAAKVSMVSSTAIANWDKTNALKKLKEIIGKVRRYRSEGLVLYVRPEIMDALSLDETFKRNIQADTIVADGKALQTRITNIDGTPVIEVIHVERFYTALTSLRALSRRQARRILSMSLRQLLRQRSSSRRFRLFSSSSRGSTQKATAISIRTARSGILSCSRTASTEKWTAYSLTRTRKPLRVRR